MNCEPSDTSLAELKTINFARLPREHVLQISESDFPDCLITRKGKVLNCQISEHIYTKYLDP